MRAPRTLLSVALGATLVVSACGGDDDESGEETDSTTIETVSDTVSDTAADTVSEGSVPASTAGADTTTGDTGEAGDFCATVQPLAEFNAEQPPLDTSGEFDVVQDSLVSTIEGGLVLYEDAVEAAPDDIRGQLETLQTFNEDIIPVIEDSSTLDEILESMTEMADEDVLTATTELDSYLQDNCGFGLTQSS